MRSSEWVKTSRVAVSENGKCADVHAKTEKNRKGVVKKEFTFTEERKMELNSHRRLR